MFNHVAKKIAVSDREDAEGLELHDSKRAAQMDELVSCHPNPRKKSMEFYVNCLFS